MTLKGHIKIYELVNPGRVLFEQDNLIVNSSAYLFARLLANSLEPAFGVWGLAIGAGGSGSNGWSATQQPDPVPTDSALVSEIMRKRFTSASFLDVNGNPTSNFTTTVLFQTVLNATTDNIQVPIREMGLIGGGTNVGTPTNMTTAPYFDPTNPAAQPGSVILINYKTLAAFYLPAQTSVAIDWSLACA
jgi:hypothetical protein